MRQNNTTDKIIDYNNENCNIFPKYDCKYQRLDIDPDISSPKKYKDALNAKKNESKIVSDLEESELMYYFSDITSNHITCTESSQNSILSLKPDYPKLLHQVDYASHKIKKKKIPKEKILKEKPQINKKTLTPMDFYQYSLNRPCKKTSDMIINTLREHYKKKKLMFNHNTQAMVLSKGLTLNWLPTHY